MKRINLMLIERNERKHYIWIKDFNKMLYDQTKHKAKKHFCETCLHGYSEHRLLLEHQVDCQGITNRAVRVEMPEPDKNILKFQDHSEQLKAPYVIYADFESIIRPIHSVANDPSKGVYEKDSIA